MLFPMFNVLYFTLVLSAVCVQSWIWLFAVVPWCRALLLLLLLLLLLCMLCGRSQWPCGLRRGSAVARLLGLWVRIPPEAWMSVSCECCVLSGRGLCVGLITCPEESYRVWCVSNVWSWSVVKWDGIGPLGAVEPLEKKCILCTTYSQQNTNRNDHVRPSVCFSSTIDGRNLTIFDTNLHWRSTQNLFFFRRLINQE